MQNLVRPMLAAIFTVGIAAATLHASDYANREPISTVYVMTNDAAKNEVLAYKRLFDGRLTLKERIATGGRGSGGTTDPLQSQGSLTLSQDHNFLFAINSGSGTLSAFRLIDGIPVLVDQEPVDGSEPVAVAEHDGTIYVLDAGGNGTLAGFHLDRLGRLRPIQQSAVRLTGTHTGGSSISISPNGRVLVVIEKVPNNIDTLPINPDGTLGALIVNHSVTPGVFAGSFTPSGQLIVSENQPGGNDASSISSYQVNRNGTITAISQSLPTLGDGNCWNVVTPNGKFVYADNSATSTVAGFEIAPNGTLVPIAGTIQSSKPSGSTNLDLATSADGKFIYTLDSGAGSIGLYEVTPDGALRSLGDIDGLPKTVGFNGIAAL